VNTPDIEICSFASCSPWDCPSMFGCDSTPCEVDDSHRKIVLYTQHGGMYGEPLDAVGGHGTHVAGTVAGAADSAFAGEYNGTAPGAKIAFDDISPDGWSLYGLPYDLNDLFPHSYDAGARIHTNSWGSYGASYTFQSMEVDQYTYEHDDFLVVFAAGNAGPVLGSVGSPATSKNCLSVGSSSNTRVSYIEHGYGPYFNLSMLVAGEGFVRLIDILPADFGATLSPNAEYSFFSNGTAVLDAMMMSDDEVRYFCTPPGDEGKTCAFISDSNVSTSLAWAALSGMHTFGDPNTTLQNDESWHSIFDGNCDDCFETIPDFGFDFCMFGQNVRNHSFLGSNSYITFGMGSRRYYDFGGMTIPTLRLGVGDQSYQRVYGKRISEGAVDGYLVRFEGTASTYGTPGSPNIIWEVTFWSNQSILVSTPLLSQCALYGACSLGLYDGASKPVLVFPFQSDSSALLTGFAEESPSVPYQTSAKGALLVLNFEFLSIYGQTCKPDVFSYQAQKANFESVIFGVFGGSFAWGAPAQKIFTSHSGVSSAVAIPVVSISQEDTWSIIGAFTLQYVPGYSTIYSLVGPSASGVNSTFPIVSSERSDRRFTHEDLSYFSSRGPTTDTRNKPDIIAPGQEIFSANSDGRPGSYQCGDSAGELNSSILMMSGTSMAAPGVAGAAALVRQYYEEGFHVGGEKNTAAGFKPSSALVKATILHSGSQIRFQADLAPPPYPGFPSGYGYGYGPPGYYGYDGEDSPVSQGSPPGGFDHSSTQSTLHPSRHLLDHEMYPSLSPARFSWSPGAQSPSFEQGYGLMDLSSALSFVDSKFKIFPFDRQLLNHSTHRDFCFTTAAEPDARFRASMVWTDPPGFPYAAKALVNNLDLSVITDGHFFYGNAPNTGDRYLDSNNNVEQITLEDLPANADIRVRATGTDIPEGPQEFSLLVTGAISRIDCPQLSLEPACENDCSGHGTCIGGICSCDTQFAGASCGINECGNGKISDIEQCDDGNEDDGDGCSSECVVEDGFRCQQPDFRYPSACTICECGCLHYRDEEGFIDGSVPSDYSSDFLCTSEITRAGDGEIQILVEKMSPGSSMDMVISRPCRDGYTCDMYGCRQTDSWQTCEEIILYTPEMGMFEYYMGGDFQDSLLTQYEGMHGVRMQGVSKVLLTVSTMDDYGIRYGNSEYNVCGDGIRDKLETCDDRNTESGDGCSSRCWQECDFNRCCKIELTQHGTITGSDFLWLLPNHELSPVSACLELHVPAQKNSSAMLDVTSDEIYYSDSCPFSGREQPLDLVGPALGHSVSAESEWTELFSSNGLTDYAIPDIGFDFCLLGNNVRHSIAVHTASFITFGSGGYDSSRWSAANPASPTLFLGTVKSQHGEDGLYGYLSEATVFSRNIAAPRQGYVLRVEGTWNGCWVLSPVSGCWSTESEQILYEVTLWSDNTIHIASARAPGGNLAMLTNGIGETIVRFGLSHISTIIPATAGCGMGDAPRSCSLLHVSGRNISSAVDSLGKFRSDSRPLVVRHLSKSAYPWQMHFSMTWWNGFSPARCGNGLLDAPEMTLYAETCIVTNAFERVCRRNVTIPTIPAEAGEVILAIEVQADMFADWGSSITDIYIDSVRHGGNYLSGSYNRVCGEKKQIAEFAVLSEPGSAPRDVVVEIHFLHESFWTYVPGPTSHDEIVPYVPCFCPSCTQRVLDSLIMVKMRNPVEECDDANQVNGDGCSDLCRVEPGASCDGASREKGPSVCSGGSGGASCSNRCLVEVPQHIMHWGEDPRYWHCTLPLTWKEIHQARFSDCSLSYKTGGLGDLLEVEAFESWLCAHDHPCASNYLWDTYFCFVYDEMRQTFIPWGENAELHLVDT